MSKRCPYCGSYNTEVAVLNYAGRFLVNTGRVALTAGAAIVGGLFNHAAGHVAAHNTWEKTDPGELKGYHCCNCNKDFR